MGADCGEVEAKSLYIRAQVAGGRMTPPRLGQTRGHESCCDHSHVRSELLGRKGSACREGVAGETVEELWRGRP